MIRILEGIDTNVESQIQEIIDEIMDSLADEVKVAYIDKTLMPNELAIELIWESEPGVEEYIGTWEINMNKSDVDNYSKYLNDISNDIQDAYAYIEEYEKSLSVNQ